MNASTVLNAGTLGKGSGADDYEDDSSEINFNVINLRASNKALKDQINELKR